MLANKPAFEKSYIKMWISNSILHVKYPPKSIVTLEIAKKIVEDRLVYVEGVNYPGFVDGRNIKKIELDAMRYFATKEAYELTNRVALYSDRFLGTIISNFWLKLDKPPKPTKYFTNIGSAYLFLKNRNAN